MSAPAETTLPISNDGSASTESGNESIPVTVLEPRGGWHLIDWHDLWKFRELLVFLAWRDIKVRYKQTVLGAAWAVLQPFATMIVFSFFLAKRSGVGENYSLFAFAGLVPWFFFANALTTASQSIVTNQTLVTKVYFPRIIIPLAAVGAGMIDLLISFVMLVVMMLFYGVTPGWGLLLSIIPILGLIAAALGAGTLLSALTVAYRDFRYVVPFMVQFGLFATPNIYLDPTTEVSTVWQYLLPLNPAYGFIGNFRAALLEQPLDYYSLVISTLVTALLLLAGCVYFRRVEQIFADII